MRVSSNIGLSAYKRYIFIFFICIFYLQTSGADRYSVASGSWGSTNTWSATSGGSAGVSVPVAGDNVYIEGGWSVSLDANSTITNLTISSGTLNFNTSTGSKTLTVSSNVNVAGGTIDLNTSSTSSNGVLSVKGNFTFSSGTIQATQQGTYPGTPPGNQILLSGSSLQNLNCTASFGSNFVLRVGNTTVGALVQLQSGKTLTGSCRFQIDASANLGITDANGITIQATGAVGQIQVTGTRTYSTTANYTYNGTSAQVTGNGLTSAKVLTINNNNAAGVTLSTNVSIANAGGSSLTFTNGILNTSSSAILSILNNVNTSVSGASASNYVNGPLKWTLNGNGTTQYSFPVGKGGTYLPFSITPTGTAPVIQVEATQGDCGGALGTLTSLSTTEYWYASIIGGTYTNGIVGLTRQSALGTLNVIGRCSTKNGTYNNLNGTPGVNSITVSDATSNSLDYFVMASTSACTPATLTLGSNEPGLASQCVNTTKVILQSFSLSVSSGTCNGNLTDVGFTSTGSYVQADVSRYQLWYNSSSTFSSASQLGTSLTSSGGAGARLFASFANPTLTAGNTYYFWITADITAVATNNNTIAVNGIATTDLTTSGGSSFAGGTTNAGGTQTIKAVPTASVAGTNQSQCNNGNFTLAANSPTIGTGTWTCFSGCGTVNITTPSSNTSTVTGVAAGTPAVLTWTISNSPCTASASNVTLTNSPTNAVSVSISANPSGAICSGTSVGFTATPTNGGTTPAYQWQKNGINVGTNSNTYSDAGLVNGDQITCVLTSNVACPTPSNIATSNTITMTVNALPFVTASATPATVCSGASITLSASPSSAPTYAWSSGCGGNVATCSIIPGASITYTVTLTDANNCTATSSTSVTVNTVPTASAGGNQSVCTGSSITLNGSDGCGGTCHTAWSWSTGESTQNIAPSPTVITTYTLTVYNSSCTATSSAVVTVKSAGSDQTYTGTPVTLTATGGSSWNWSTSATTQSITVTPLANTTYTVTIDGTCIDQVVVTAQFIETGPCAIYNSSSCTKHINGPSDVINSGDVACIDNNYYGSIAMYAGTLLILPGVTMTHSTNMSFVYYSGNIINQGTFIASSHSSSWDNFTYALQIPTNSNFYNCLSGTTTLTVTQDGDNGIQFNNNSSGTYTNNGATNINFNSTNNTTGISFNGGGPVLANNASGSFTINTGANYGVSYSNNINSGTLNNYGNFTVTSPVTGFYFMGYGTLNNYQTMTVTGATSRGIYSINNSGNSISNSGTFTIGTSSNTLDAIYPKGALPITNNTNGRLIISKGNINLTENNSGNSIANNGLIDVQDGDINLGVVGIITNNYYLKVSGAGHSFNQSGGTTNNNNKIMAYNFNMTGGTFNNSCIVHTTNNYSQSGGNINGQGTGGYFHINPGNNASSFTGGTFGNCGQSLNFWDVSTSNNKWKTQSGSSGGCATYYGAPNNLPARTSSCDYSLPVELALFSLVCKNSTVVINWTTASETNNDYFTLYKSVDGIDFIELQRIKGAGNSTQTLNYSFTDDNPLVGLNFYYLKQTDYNGKAEQFPVKEILFKPDINGKTNTLTILPNPVIDQKISFILNGYTDEKVEVSFMDVLGNIQYSVTMIARDNNVETLFLHGNVPPGIYFLNLSSNRKTITGKVIIP